MNWKLILQWLGVCLIAALFFYLFFYLGKLRGESMCPENPDSSNEAYNQSKIEAVKWKFKYDSVSVEYGKVLSLIERKKSNSTKKIKQNETTKKQDAALSDSAVYILRDSLRAEYRKRYFAKDSIPRFSN